MILAVLILPVAIGLVALAVEGGLWYADRHELRAIADAGVMAAAYARKDGEDEAAAALDAGPDVGFDEDTDEIEVQSPPQSGSYEGQDDAIEVIVRRQRPLLLSTLFLDGQTIAISMRSVAMLGRLPNPCIEATHSSAPGAITISGNGQVNLTGCGLMSDSTSNIAIDLNGGGSLSADYIAAVGNYDQSGSGTLNVADIAMGTAPLDDPFGDMTVNPPAGCTYNSTWKDSGGHPSPAPQPNNRFCNGMDINGTVNLSPGTYYITGGTLNISSQAKLSGSGVTFVVTGTASVNINGGATVNLTAPQSGALKGMVFFSTSTDTHPVKFNGGSTMKLDGAVYFRNQDLVFNGNNGTSGGCLRLVASTISITGASNMGGACDLYGFPPHGPYDNVKLVE
ncbi:MAG: Tad domain-containing protein [Solirubrobacterales bacterium]